MRTLLSFVVFFVAGAITTTVYIYSRHPGQSPLDDVPHLRRDVENMIDHGRRLHDAWQTREADPAATQPAAEEPKPEPPKTPEPPAKPPRNKSKSKVEK